MRATRVAVIQPAITSYRSEFFTRLLPAAREQGFEVVVFVGETAPELAGRRDTTRPDYAQELATATVRLGKRHLLLRSPAPVLRGQFDLVVVEQAVRNVDTYAIAAILGIKRTAFWGHGRTYTRPVSSAHEAFKMWLTRRGSWFFAYTEGGADAVRAAGFPADRVSVLNNTIDTEELSNDLCALGESEKRDFAATHSLTDQTALFVGGLDESKRVSFLLEAADEIHNLTDRFRLIVCGAGEQESLVRAAASARPWITYLGPVRGSSKALAMDAARAIMMPGRVGLVAVDSFAASTPIVTTNWDWHAPEFEYLRDGYNSVITRNTVRDFAAGVAHVLTDDALNAALVAGARESAGSFSLDQMVHSFVAGLTAWRERSDMHGRAFVRAADE